MKQILVLGGNAVVHVGTLMVGGHYLDHQALALLLAGIVACLGLLFIWLLIRPNSGQLPGMGGRAR